MKRHLSLEPFSRDHNVGLALARRLTLASAEAQSVRRQVVQSLVRYWRDELEDHFVEEERMLCPMIRSKEFWDRMLAEHCEFHALVDELSSDMVDRVRVARAGALLHDHIRWEERTLFPEIERTASERELRSLLEQTAVLEESRAQSSWAPKRGELMRARAAAAVLAETGD